jgi:hypothetical protein
MPPPPAAAGAPDLMKEDLEGVHKVMADMLVMALACDITRVFNLEFTSAQAQTVFWQVNFLKPIHDNTHQAASPDADMLNAAEFSHKQFGYLLGRLMATPQGAGNLLDSMAIYYVNEYLVGAPHTMKNGNHPILVVGKANGALRSGQYLKPAAVENGSRVGLALLHSVGVMAPSFGVAAGMATAPLPGLLA